MLAPPPEGLYNTLSSRLIKSNCFFKLMVNPVNTLLYIVGTTLKVSEHE